MTNYLGLGAVSATLQSLLRARMEIPALPSGGTTVPVTLGTPNSEEDVAAPRLNLLLYRITENPFLKNQEIPGSGHPAAYGKPPLALDLHYLMTAYGASSETEGELSSETLAHQILGSAMRVFHDYTIITETIKDSLNNPILDPALRGQFEKLTISQELLSLDDLSKIWTALTVPMRVSAGYLVTVVQIESKLARPEPKRVGPLPDAGPRVVAVTFQPPRLEQVLVKRQGTPPNQLPSPILYARIGDQMILRGNGFIDQDTRARIKDVLINPSGTPPLNSREFSIILPDHPSLQPGVLALEVVRMVEMSSPPEKRPAFTSNQAAFTLTPHVTSASLAGGVVTVNGTRLWQERKNCLTVLGDQVVPGKAYTTSTSTQIQFALPTLAAGDYVVRVRVNGAESIDPVSLNVP